MRSKLVARLGLAVTLAAMPWAALAQSASPLTLDEVLRSSRDHAPQIAEAIAKVRSSEGKLLSTQGAFDTVVSAEATGRALGYYDGRTLGGTVTKPLADIGGSVYGGYRVSGGRFPIYEDENYTNALGELRVGAVFSLLRDRLIDDRRFARRNAAIDVDIAEADRLLTAITVQRRAVAAYNQWVAAGLRLARYRELLALARGRQAGLEKQVAAGARPRIILTENEQNVLRRETLVARAEQELAQAANTLSLFWRDDMGLRRQPDPSRLPDALPSLPLPAGPRDATVAARPELRQIDLRIAQTNQRLALDRNALNPKLDFKVELAKDVGAVGPGGVSRTPTEAKVGVTFSLPLERRAARGRVAQTSADLEAFRQKRRQTEDQINAELDALAIDVKATARLRDLADAEHQRAQMMAAAEAKRFAAGASDFFLVNSREEAAADAFVRKLDAAVRQTVARAELAAAAVDLGTLGLE